MIEETLKERQNTHGPFTGNSFTSQELKQIMRMSPNWSKLSPHQREAIDMTCHKFGRILHGDPNYHDHWHDIIGYIRLVEQDLEKHGK